MDKILLVASTIEGHTLAQLIFIDIEIRLVMNCITNYLTLIFSYRWLNRHRGGKGERDRGRRGLRRSVCFSSSLHAPDLNSQPQEKENWSKMTGKFKPGLNPSNTSVLYFSPDAPRAFMFYVSPAVIYMKVCLKALGGNAFNFWIVAFIQPLTCT